MKKKLIIKTRKRNSSKKLIKTYWQDYLIKIGKFDSIEDLWEDDWCFACGFEGPTERAHIIAHIDGGSGEPDNIHLLCAACHKQSEYLSGDKYFEWLQKQTLISSALQQIALSSKAYVLQEIAYKLAGVTQW